MKKLSFILAYLLLAVPCSAGIIPVDDDGPADFSTIQAAINAAVNGDTIIVAPGTYTGEGNYLIDFLGKAITVRSADPNDPNTVAATIIQAGSWFSGFYFHRGENANSILTGVTIINSGEAVSCHSSSPTIASCIVRNNGPYGIYCYDSNATIADCTIGDNDNGIYCRNSNPVITNCTISDSSDRGISCGDGSPAIANCIITNNSGSGIYCSSSGTTIINCTISGNGGVGIYCDDSNPTVTNCTISNNSDSGIRCYDSSPIVTGCTITGNSPEHSGGGIFGCNGPITDCIISGNFAYGGGGLYFCDGPITDCIITGNSSVGSGGGLFNCFGGPITNCVIAGNSTNKYGGGFSRFFGPIINCTITGNSAAVSSGGLSAVSEATNCIIWGNWPDQINTSSPPQITYSNIQGGLAGLGNINADPCFVQPGFWADVNDPNIIVEPNDPNAVWIDGDYHLQSEGWSWDIKRKRWTYDDVTSRCIDAGNPGSPLGDELLSIPDDPDNEWGQNLRIDMGAFGGTVEASIPPYDWVLLSDLTNNGLVDLADLAHQAADWLNSADQQPGDLNRDSLIDISDLALLIEDWLGQTTWHQ